MSSINESSISASSIASAIEFAGGEAPRRYNRGFRGAGPPFPNSRLHDKATDSTDRNKAPPRKVMYRRCATRCTSCSLRRRPMLVGNPGQRALGISQGRSRMPSHLPRNGADARLAVRSLPPASQGGWKYYAPRQRVSGHACISCPSSARLTGEKASRRP
jgi:hypothetical protein